MKQLYCWDFTLHCNELYTKDDYMKVKAHIAEIAKAGNFQLEEGEKTGKLHYQGRISLKKKRRKTEIIKLATDEFLKGIHWTPTSNENKGNFDYVTKQHTRKEGPWDVKEKNRYIPRQIREIKKLRPFQQQIVDDVGVWDTRHINIVYDEQGCNGKSVLKGYLRAYGLGRPLPPINDYRDMLRTVCDVPTAKLYLVDMPRAIKKNKLGGFYAAIETIKDGYAYDDRYTFTEKFFDSPNIWIFTNTLPEFKLMSKDRWITWSITEDTFELVKWNATWALLKENAAAYKPGE